jgi:hypothetical protein
LIQDLGLYSDWKISGLVSSDIRRSSETLEMSRGNLFYSPVSCLMSHVEQSQELMSRLNTITLVLSRFQLLTIPNVQSFLAADFPVISIVQPSIH